MRPPNEDQGILSDVCIDLRSILEENSVFQSYFLSMLDHTGLPVPKKLLISDRMTSSQGIIPRKESALFHEALFKIKKTAGSLPISKGSDFHC